eukprot:15483807-Alexandrium_andersonii.AAC.1
MPHAVAAPLLAWPGARPTATLVCATRIPARRVAHRLRTSFNAPRASLAGPSCARTRMTVCPAAA